MVALAVLSPIGHAETVDEPIANQEASTGRIRVPFERLSAELAVPGRTKVTLPFAQDRHIPRALCGYATEHGFDMLVLGRHGNGGAVHSKLGHVAEAVVHTGKVPVLLLSAP